MGIMLSSSLKQSVEVLKRIRDKILSNEVLKTAVPDNKTANWSKTEIELKNGARCLSMPNNENIRGYHVDYIGSDEIGEWKNWDIITKTIPPMVTAKDGTLVFVGTPTSEIDFIHKLEKNEAYTTQWYPANAKNEESKTLWSLRYPNVKMSEKRKEYDSLSWSREFLLKPLSSADQIFPYRLIETCFDYDAVFEDAYDSNGIYFLGLDFALSGEAGADYTVMTVLKRIDDKMKVVKIERYKGLSYQAQKLRVIQLHQTYKPSRIVADEGTFGKTFLQDLIAEHVPIEGFRFTNQSKQDLITRLRRQFEQKTLVIPRDKSDIATQTQIEHLIKELSAFGVAVNQETGVVRLEGIGAHDDMVFSLALAVYGGKGMAGTPFAIRRGNKSGIRIRRV